METIIKRLESLAWKKSHSFCYGCYKRVTGTHCDICGSDDSMREFPGIGLDWGVVWISKHLVEENLEPVDTESAFEESVAECYAETVTVGWMNLDTISVI